MVEIILVIIASYLIGSISPSIILGKILKGIDIREHGSGNAGSTNAFRVLGKWAGITVLLLDIFKGYFAVKFISPLTGENPVIVSLPNLSPTLVAILSGFAAVTGHVWTVFHSFKGGKGVNTATGVLLAVIPIPTILAACVFLIVLFITRYVSLGSMLASLSLPIILIIMSLRAKGEAIPSELIIFAAIIPIFIIYTHRANIKRLRRGEENKIKLGRG
ncbi:MAG: glycerol-3-phosphate 1-O-acyltransferase PlsY [Nitrospinae bacterium]|nr:glycerol-3-phosphate 1-O-acyltransferase PlsY [Nitrospinota bacterium]